MQNNMITLSNNILKLNISKKGAEIKSLYAYDNEYIWEGRKEFWGKSSPTLFPICGGLKDDKYLYQGKEYSIPKHGFVKDADFELEDFSQTKAVFLHKSNNITKKMFPFEYELRIIFTIHGASVDIEYKVSNSDDKTMYFSIGSHEGYFTPDGIEDYDVIFQNEETLNSHIAYGNLLSDQTVPILKESRTLPLYERYFAVDALIFKDISSKSLTLRNRKTGSGVQIDYDFANHLLIWHKYASPFICIEPWAGLPDHVSSDYDITKKEAIIFLNAGETYSAKHTISVF